MIIKKIKHYCKNIVGNFIGIFLIICCKFWNKRCVQSTFCKKFSKKIFGAYGALLFNLTTYAAKWTYSGSSFHVEKCEKLHQLDLINI